MFNWLIKGKYPQAPEGATIYDIVPEICCDGCGDYFEESELTKDNGWFFCAKCIAEAKKEDDLVNEQIKNGKYYVNNI